MRIILTVWIVLLAGSCAEDRSLSEHVRTASGPIEGVVGDAPGVLVFKGIPYAAPPIGNLRWRPPEQASAWTDVRPADRFGPTCMQVPPPTGSFYQKEFFPVAEAMSEDCLFLNVWSPARSRGERLPVMVWIHGGAFSQGSGSMPSFHGEGLARKGVVLVTINYRLGVFGLLAHPELSAESSHDASGNYGLLDQVTALEWTRDNIEAFGGDPENVTLFGQSSGAGNVNTLMASPLARGLFHRAILQSGSVFAFGRKETLAQAESEGLEFADAVSASSVADLRDLTADSLLKAGRRFSFGPVIDDRLLPDPVDVVFARGDQLDIPILAGSTADEGTTMFGPALTAERFTNLVAQQFGEDASTFLQYWPARSDVEAKRSFNAGFSDEMAWGAQALAEQHLRTSSSDAFLYHFNHDPPGREQDRYGAFHSSEIVYVFSNLEAVDRPWQRKDSLMADVMSTYWANFAATGNPNGGMMPEWPAFDPEHRRVMQLGADRGMAFILDEDKRRFFERRWSERHEVN